MKKAHPPKRILIVDDETFITTTLSMILRNNGYSVEAVNRGDQAIPILNHQDFDLVILDLVMPGMNGLDLIPLIRDCCPDVVIVMHAATIDENHQQYALQMGATEFWQKPIDPEELLDRIQHLLGQN